MALAVLRLLTVPALHVRSCLQAVPGAQDIPRWPTGRLPYLRAPKLVLTCPNRLGSRMLRA